MPVTFPAETKQYREARSQLLKAELELRRQIEEVAAMRRRLPVGGEVAEDYAFEEGAADLADTQTVGSVRLSQLFEPGKDSLLLYSYMYGPKMKQPCPMCTSFLDGLNGTAPHARQRINLAVEARSPIGRIRGVARERGWKNLRLLSSANSGYHRAYHGESENEDQNPMMNVFVRRAGKIHHFWGSEMLFTGKDDAIDARHIDMVWPLWHLFDVTPEGRGSDWYPKLRY